MDNEERKKEIGEILKAERARKGLSLEEVQSKIKIHKRFIKALESNDFSSIPTKVAAKGFLKTYAMFLGVPAEPLLQELREKLGVDAPEKSRVSHQPLENGKQPPFISNVDPKHIYFAAAGLVIVLLLIFSSFAGLRIIKHMNRVKKPPVAAAPVEPVVKLLTLEAQFIDKSWVLVTLDRGAPTEEYFGEGARRVWTVTDRIKIKVGNAGGVRLTVNGEDMGLMGGVGAVVEKEFKVE